MWKRNNRQVIENIPVLLSYCSSLLQSCSLLLCSQPLSQAATRFSSKKNPAEKPYPSCSVFFPEIFPSSSFLPPFFYFPSSIFSSPPTHHQFYCSRPTPLSSVQKESPSQLPPWQGGGVIGTCPMHVAHVETIEAIPHSKTCCQQSAQK